MKINTSLKIATKTELKLTAQTKLWLDIISIPAIELKEKIEKALEENPFLEYDIKNYSKSIDDIIVNTVASDKESLFEHLKSQIRIVFSNEKDILLAEQIASFINKEGYLNTDYNIIAETININIKKVIEIINILKTLDPIGIASKNIEECLSTQLKQKSDIDEDIKKISIEIVEKYLKELSKKNYDEIAINIGVSRENILEALKIIQTLEPYPAREYDTTTIKYIIPELFILKENDKWTIKTNETFIPHLKINKKYSKLVYDSTVMKDKKKEAESLINATNERKKTLLKVGAGLLDLQLNFFENGKEFIKPLRLKDLASYIGLSESTISRISNGKYFNTIWGTFSIKYLFSKSVSGGISSRTVKEMIKRIIEESQAKLSDEKIRLILKSEGIEISRRTISKYRKDMNILSSRLR